MDLLIWPRNYSVEASWIAQTEKKCSVEREGLWLNVFFDFNFIFLHNETIYKDYQRVIRCLREVIRYKCPDFWHKYYNSYILACLWSFAQKPSTSICPYPSDWPRAILSATITEEVSLFCDHRWDSKEYHSRDKSYPNIELYRCFQNSKKRLG